MEIICSNCMVESLSKNPQQLQGKKKDWTLNQALCEIRSQYLTDKNQSFTFSVQRNNTEIYTYIYIYTRVFTFGILIYQDIAMDLSCFCNSQINCLLIYTCVLFIHIYKYWFDISYFSFLICSSSPAWCTDFALLIGSAFHSIFACVSSVETRCCNTSHLYSCMQNLYFFCNGVGPFEVSKGVSSSLF